MTEKTTATHPGGRTIEWGAGAGATTEFERLYRANVDAVTAYFARRAAEPQVVADLTADTFVAAITSFGSFDPRKGTARAWLFGIARRVYASYCETYSQQQHRLNAGRAARARPGPGPGTAQPDRRRAGLPGHGGRAGRAAGTRPRGDRACGHRRLRPQEAAAALGLAPGTVRMRLLRARARLAGKPSTSKTPASTTIRSGVTAMTKFADHLFDDLMREHGSTLSNARPPAPEAAHRDPPGAAGGRRGRRRRRGRRGVLVATAGTNPAAQRPGRGGKTPAYAVTNNLNGTVTLAVYRKSGIAGANAKLHELGESQVYVVPVGPAARAFPRCRRPPCR